ncbi:MAG: hypothetical protein E6J36_06995 [Chloroflexi bacterium]|nr:MAG: hypothetical protein E6J36_06995 [Chloroflexota bacterium]
MKAPLFPLELVLSLPSPSHFCHYPLVLWRRDQQRTTDLRPFPAQAATARGRRKERRQDSHGIMLQGRTAGTGCRHGTEGRCQQACARGVCSPFEGKQAIRLTLLPLLQAELGRPSKGPVAPPP